MLKIKNLSVNAGGKHILNDFNLNIKKNEVHVIMGPNGAGKSTICKAIMGHDDYEVTSGKIIYENEEINGQPVYEIAQKGIFYLLQNPTEIHGVTNAELLRTARNERGIKESIFEFNKRLNEVCEKLQIDKNFIHRNTNENMSGGEKKKNELLHLYMLKPNLILLDEMDSGLDIDGLDTLCKALNEYKSETKCSILIITHHTNILKHIHPDKVHVLFDGKIIQEGDSKLAEMIELYGFKGAFNMSASVNNE